MIHAKLYPLGPDGVLVQFADRLSEPANRAALAFRAALDASPMAGVVETATSLTSTFVRFQPDEITRDAVSDYLGQVLAAGDWQDAALPKGRKRWHIPASFEGENAPDLEAAAALAEVTPETAIQQVVAAPLRVLALGFAPGQPYLGFLPDNWDIPRQSEVTPQVPKGAVVIAVRQVIPFANAAPTGWRQIGRSSFRCYDPDSTPALPLSPGDEVRFQAVSSELLARLSNRPFGGADHEALP